MDFKKKVKLLIVTTAIIRIIIARLTGLGIGESYYFGGVMHPSLSYFDQPPLFFWLAILSTKLFGLTPIGLRIPSIILFAISTWILFLITKRFYSEKAAFYSCIILNLSFVFTIPTAIWLQPDAVLIIFWLATIYGLIQIFYNNISSIKPIYWWIFTGIMLGLATLSKYHSVFLVFGSIIFILFNKNQRHWLKNPGPYIAIAICLAFIIPVLLWNEENNWVSFVFQGSRAGSNTTGLHFDWFFRSIIGQALWIAPWIWYPAIQQLYICFKNTTKNQFNSFLFWLAFPPIAFFTIITLWTNTAFHFHWQAPGYIILFIPLGNFIVNKENTNSAFQNLWKGWWQFSLFFLISFSMFALIYTETGFLKQFGPHWFTKKFIQVYDPTIEGYDFNDIATRFKKEGWTNNPNIFIITDKWWNAGKIDWPLRGKVPVLVFSDDPRNYTYFDKPVNQLGKDAIILTQHIEQPFLDRICSCFKSVQQLPDINIYRGGIKEVSYKVLWGNNFRISEKK